LAELFKPDVVTKIVDLCTCWAEILLATDPSFIKSIQEVGNEFIDKIEMPPEIVSLWFKR
jgi:hypothetical protein